MTTTTDTTFEHRVNTNRREATSVLQVATTDTGTITLEVQTSHSAGRGYSITISRPHNEGYARGLVIGFGGPESTDILKHPQERELVATIPPRYNVTRMQEIHQAAYQHVADNLERWVTWAAQSLSAQRD